MFPISNKFQSHLKTSAKNNQIPGLYLLLGLASKDLGSSVGGDLLTGRMLTDF